MSSKGNGEGSVYYNKQRKKWNAQYKEYDTKTGRMKYKTKSFKTENEAQKYLNTIMYQKENPIYIEHNGKLDNYNSFNFYLHKNELCLKQNIINPYFIQPPND